MTNQQPPAHPPQPDIALMVIALLIVAGCIHTAAAGVVSLVRGEFAEQVIGTVILLAVTAIGVAQYAAIGRRSERAARAMVRICWAFAALHALQVLYLAALMKAADAIVIAIFTALLIAAGYLNQRWAQALHDEIPTPSAERPPFQLSLREILGAMAAVVIVAALAAYQMQKPNGN